MIFDVFIVGGGLSGLNTASHLLKNSDLRIGLADRKRSGQNNPARFTFSELIKTYGLEDCIINTYNSFGILSYHGARVVHDYPDAVFFALDYNKACNIFLTWLSSRQNFIKYNCRVNDIEIDENFINVNLADGKKIKTKLMIDASGSSHFSLKYLNIAKPSLYSHSFGQSFTGCNNTNSDTAYFVGASVAYGSGGGWYYPIGRSEASFGMALITKTKQFPAKELREKYDRAKNEIEPICSFLKNAGPVKYEVGTIPIQPIYKYVHDRILIVGDSGGQATSWMCMGVEPVLSNSEMAAKAILNARTKTDFDLEKLNEYQDAWDKKNKKIFDHIENQSTKIWFLGEDVWDFIIEKDLKKINSKQFYDRIKTNAYLMPPWKALPRWLLFRFQHLFDFGKYKQHQAGDIS
jgi:flavin-dependent dehydrogenase